MEGLKQKYNITKADGSKVDENARYFVLRVDDTTELNTSIEIAHRNACKKALGLWMLEMRKIFPEIVEDLQYEWDVRMFDWDEQLRTIEDRAIDMFFATTSYKPYTVDTVLNSGYVTVEGSDYNGYSEGQFSFYVEDLFIENFEEHVKEIEEKKQKALEMKAKAEHAVKKLFEEKQEKELLTKLKEKYEKN